MFLSPRAYLFSAHTISTLPATTLSFPTRISPSSIQPSDFDAYCHYHARRLFRPAYEPRPLCFAVRRSPSHSPEGVLRVEEDSITGGAPVPIYTICATAAQQSSHGGAGARPRMEFALSAEARVAFGGDVMLHGWLSHRFGSGPRRAGAQPAARSGLTLAASARQFSSFILLVGKIASPTVFEPSSAILLKDKDEIAIPLACADLPTPGEFRDAIASLSPEQARFARAFRAMQLESTLFAVLVLHVKPQLEILLNLAPDALTKEIELTQASHLAE